MTHRGLFQPLTFCDSVTFCDFDSHLEIIQAWYYKNWSYSIVWTVFAGQVGKRGYHRVFERRSLSFQISTKPQQIKKYKESSQSNGFVSWLIISF